MSQIESITVFFPAYNDAPSLPALIAKTMAVLRETASDYEVIVVNDGSRDDTGEVLRKLVNEYGARLRVVTHARNQGYGAALRSGFDNASKDWVFYTDGDGQYDVGELPSLIEAVRSDVGLVNGYKLERADPQHRVLIGKCYNAFARTLFRIRLRDVDCDFRLIRRSLLEGIHLTSTSGTVCVELVRKLELSGWPTVEIGVHHYPRLYGKSQFFRVRSLLTTFRQLVSLYVRTVFLVQVWSWMGRLAQTRPAQSEAPRI